MILLDHIFVPDRFVLIDRIDLKSYFHLDLELLRDSVAEISTKCAAYAKILWNKEGVLLFLFLQEFTLAGYSEVEKEFLSLFPVCRVWDADCRNGENSGLHSKLFSVVNLDLMSRYVTKY